MEVHGHLKGQQPCKFTATLKDDKLAYLIIFQNTFVIHCLTCTMLISYFSGQIPQNFWTVSRTNKSPIKKDTDLEFFFAETFLQKLRYWKTHETQYDFRPN